MSASARIYAKARNPKEHKALKNNILRKIDAKLKKHPHGSSSSKKNDDKLLPEVSLHVLYKKYKNLHRSFIDQQLKKGTEVELEHTKDRSTARRIASQHLNESIYYYILLEEMEANFAEGGSIGSSYDRRVSENMQHLGTEITEWSPIEVIGKKDVVVKETGKEYELPLFDFPKDYDKAESLFKNSNGTNSDTVCCELCGKMPIKVVYWIKNDQRKLVMIVGSECVTHFADGKSGKENLRLAKITLAKILDSDLIRLRKLVIEKKSRVRDIGYGRKERQWDASNFYYGYDENMDKQFNIIKELNIELLYDKKQKESKLFEKEKKFYWKNIYENIPLFGWEQAMKSVPSYESKESLEKRLLTWFKKNEEYAQRYIQEVISVLKVDGTRYEEGEYYSEYLSSKDDSIVDANDFETGGELIHTGKENYRDALKSLLLKPNQGLGLLLRGNETFLYKIENAFTYTSRGTVKKTYPVDIVAYQSDKGIRYVAYDDDVIVAAAFVTNDNLLTGVITEWGFEKVGIGYNLLQQVIKLSPGVKPSGIISKEGEKIVSKVWDQQNFKAGGELKKYEYTEADIKKRWKTKKDAIANLSDNIQRLRYGVTRDLQSDNEKVFLTALVVSLMDKTAERVGNQDSASEGHFGITCFEKKHIKIDPSGKVQLQYRGKSGVDHDRSFTDKRLAQNLQKAIDNSPSDCVFETSDGFLIKADRVNRYLSQYNVTSKDLRGYSANRWLLEKMRDKTPLGDTESKRKADLSVMERKVADKVGHTVATLRKHYLVPELRENYIEKGKIISLDKFEDGGELSNDGNQTGNNINDRNVTPITYTQTVPKDYVRRELREQSSKNGQSGSDMAENGEKSGEKLISLPDTYSSFGRLKDILQKQGYDLSIKSR